MKFEEHDKTINITSIPSTFVYFLLDHGDVVYVGQTTQNISRPYSHRQSKKYDEIYILPCSKEELDCIEGYYIDKYMPKYNALPNLKTHVSVRKAKNDLKEMLCLEGYTVRRLYKDLDILGIKPVMFSGVAYITQCDQDRISWLHRYGNLEPEE